MGILHDIFSNGQSIWYDFISREFIQSGKMKELVNTGIRGMTSNPTIFEKAIAGGDEYDEQIRTLDEQGASLDEIATELFVTDVRNACDVIRDVYDQSNGNDGFISLEVSPTLAAETEKTVIEAKKLWDAVDRPNLMIKIPATPEGIPAIRTCIGAGINVNVTLIFSLEQYRNVAEAFIAGLEDHSAAGESISSIRSVASVFVSRIDSMVDERLENVGTVEAKNLQGKAGLANTKLVYREFGNIFSGSRWDSLAKQGAVAQRPLWASTSTKNPSYPDLIYIANLIGPHTVNTVPPATLDAILDHGDATVRIQEGMDDAEETLNNIEAAGVSLSKAMDDLLEEGVEKFANSFSSLFDQLEEKRERLRTADADS